ncbi:response regulator receiver protein [Caballeronia arvi]|uniref:Response regulator receiver protein n=1 Tax=Caballeronia arvi TaxID=1777135 RepID=A0A158KNW4_9BURK|nr:response regulator [Caballeronia arvi]SAL82439.1 response regulator receiver protein [Caballeronia arvi]
MQSEAPAVPGLWATRQFKAVHPPVAVLIVDDEPLSAEALAAALIAYGFRIRIADGGLAALQTPQAWTPHVVVLDIEMPNCDGFLVAEAMRGSTRFAVVPIIAYTSLAEADVIERGKSVEIDAFYRKGNALPGLFRMIEHVAPSAVT